MDMLRDLQCPYSLPRSPLLPARSEVVGGEKKSRGNKRYIKVPVVFCISVITLTFHMERKRERGGEREEIVASCIID